MDTTMTKNRNSTLLCFSGVSGASFFASRSSNLKSCKNSYMFLNMTLNLNFIINRHYLLESNFKLTWAFCKKNLLMQNISLSPNSDDSPLQISWNQIIIITSNTTFPNFMNSNRFIWSGLPEFAQAFEAASSSKSTCYDDGDSAECGDGDTGWW